MLFRSGAFDYAADRVGLTYGAAVELNQADWAWRAGYFLMPTVSNGNVADWALFERGGYVTELEYRYAVNKRPGQLKGGVFLNGTYSGSYAEAAAIANARGITADNTIEPVPVTLISAIAKFRATEVREPRKNAAGAAKKR